MNASEFQSILAKKNISDQQLGDMYTLATDTIYRYHTGRKKIPRWLADELTKLTVQKTDRQIKEEIEGRLAPYLKSIIAGEDFCSDVYMFIN